MQVLHDNIAMHLDTVRGACMYLLVLCSSAIVAMKFYLEHYLSQGEPGYYSDKSESNFPQIIGPVFIDPSAKVDPRSKVKK